MDDGRLHGEREAAMKLGGKSNTFVTSCGSRFSRWKALSL